MIKLTTSGTLTIRPLKAVLLRETSLFSKMSPYVVCILGGFTSKSKPAIDGDKNPSWSDIFTFNRAQEKEVVFQVFNQHLLRKDDVIGGCTFPLEEVLASGKFEGTLELKYKGELSGHLTIKVDWRSANHQQAPILTQSSNWGSANNQQAPILTTQNSMPIRPVMMPPQPVFYNNAMPPQQQPNFYPPPNQYNQSYYPPPNQYSPPNQYPPLNQYPPIQPIQYQPPNQESFPVLIQSNNGNSPAFQGSRSLNPGLFGAQNVINPINPNNVYNAPPINEVKLQEFEYPKESEVLTDIEYQQKMAQQENRVKN